MFLLTGSRARGVFACVALTVSILFTLALASKANAAYVVPTFSVGAAPTQAAGHPKLTISIDPDAQKADTTGGDDLKDVTLDAPAGLQLNQSAATSKCTDAQLTSSSCPNASLVGTLSVKWRSPLGASITTAGNAYVLNNTAVANQATIGFLLKATGYKNLVVRATVSNALPVSQPSRITVTGLTRSLTTAIGLSFSATIDKIDAVFNAKANSSANGPYFTLNPSTCGINTTQATLTTWANETLNKSSSYTTTNCPGVPFLPTSTVAPTVPGLATATGLNTSFTVPAGELATQHSLVKNITIQTPNGVLLNQPALAAVIPCPDASLAADTCPAASKIGTTSFTFWGAAAAPGDVYLTSNSGNGFTIGAVSRGANGVRAITRGSVASIDANLDGTVESLRLNLDSLPAATWSAASLNITSLLLRNNCPTGNSTTTIQGASAATVVRSATWYLGICDPAPETTITSGPTDYANTTTPVFTFTGSIAGSTFACQLDLEAFAPCTSPFTTPALTQGSHNFCVRASNGVTVDPTPACQTFKVDTIAPTIIINCSPTGSSTVSCAWSTSEPNVTVTCSVDGTPRNPCPNPVVITGSGSHTLQFTGIDPAGNASSVTRSIVIDPPPPPTVVITSPSNPYYTSAATINVTYLVNGGTVIPPGTTCVVANTSAGFSSVSTSTQTNAVPLAFGLNTIVVTCVNASGSGSSAVTVGPAPNPQPLIISPANNSSTAATTTVIDYRYNGQSTIPSGVVCTVTNQTTGATMTALPGATTTTTVALAIGPNTIQVVCSNAFGSGTATVTVTRGVPPVVAITAPPPGAIVQPGPINVAFVVNGGSTIPAGTTCTVNGSSTTSTTSNVVTIVPGSNTITVACTNSFGTGTDVRSLGTELAQVDITAPSDNSSTTNPTVNVSYTVGGSSTIPAATSCVVTNLTTAVSQVSTSTSSNSVALVNGANSIRVACTNQFGSSIDSVTVNRGAADTVAPTIDGLSSSQGAGGATIAYSAADNSGATPTCTPASGTTFPFYMEGHLIVTVTCRDAAGNLNTSSLNVTSNGPADGLVAELDGGPNGSTATPAPTFTYSLYRDSELVENTNGAQPCSPGQTCAPVTVPLFEFNCTTDGDPVACGAGSFTSTALPLGVHTFCVSARGIYSDEESAPSCRTFTVISSSSAPPVVTITSPPFHGGSIGVSSTNIAYTVNGSTSIPSGTTCSVGGVSSTNASTNSAALALGTNSIPVTCSNSSGSDTKHVVIARHTGFGVGITTPAPGHTTSSANVNVTYNLWTVSGLSAACTMNGVASSSNSTNDVSLPLGTSSIELVCPWGNNVSKSSTSVTRGAAPAVAITAPADNSSAGSTTDVSYTVDGSSAIPAGTKCRVNGVSSSSTTANTVTLANGANLITVSCSNAFGFNTSTITVNSDGGSPDAPVVTITAPTEGTATTAAAITVNFTVSPADASCDHVSGTNKLLSSGANTITVSCTNSAGSGSATVNVTRVAFLSVSGSCTTTNSTTAACTWSRSGGAAPYETTCSLDGATPGSCTGGSSTVASFAQPITTSHTMRVCVSDASNQSACTNLTISPPGGSGNFVNITSGPSEGSFIDTPTATFGYAATQQTFGTPCPVGLVCAQVIVDITPYYCSLDGGTYQFCGVTTPTFPRFTTPSLGSGAHTFCVRASGVAGIDPQTRNAIPNGVFGPITCRTFTRL